MTNHHTVSEDPWAMSSLVIDPTRFIYGQTDLPTNMYKAIYHNFFEGALHPHFFEGGHNKPRYYYYIPGYNDPTVEWSTSGSSVLFL